MYKVRTNAILTAVVYLLLGLLMTVWAGMPEELLGGLVGGVLVLCGAIGIVEFFRQHCAIKLQLMIGAVMVMAGIGGVQHPGGVVDALTTVVGVLVIGHGIRQQWNMLYLSDRYGVRVRLLFALSLVTMLAGAAMVIHPPEAYTTQVRIGGLLLLYDALSTLWIEKQVTL